MASVNSDDVKDLHKAIGEQNYDIIKEMLLNDISLLYGTFESHCFAPGCDCIEYPKPVNALFNVNYCDDYPEKRQKALEIIVQLFDEGILKPEHILDETLHHVVSGHCGWDHDGALLDLLIKYLPETRWVNFRHHEYVDPYPDVGEHIHYEYTILGLLCVGYMDRKSFLKYFTLFYNMGVDPNLSLNDVSPCFYLIANSYPALLDMIQVKHTVDWKERDVRNGETALMRILRYNDKTKDGFVDEDDCYKMIGKCVDHGIELDVKTKKTHTLYDYMMTYGWTDYLKARANLTIPEDYEFNEVVLIW